MEVFVNFTAMLIVLFDEITAAFMTVPPVNIADYCNYTGLDVSFSDCGEALTDLIKMLIYAIIYVGGDWASGFGVV